MAYLAQSTMYLLPIPEPEIAPPYLSPELMTWEEYCHVYDQPECYETPPYVPGEAEGPYTLPVEVFHTGYPIFVERPEPELMPIPSELEYPSYPSAGPTSNGFMLAGLGLAALALLGSTTIKRRKHGAS
jgi:LPXTG-motif cell wall-anchored protein